MGMQLLLKRDWEARNMRTEERCVIPAGTHEIERVAHPQYECFWFVLKGTSIGAAEKSWRQWQNGVLSDSPDHEDYGRPIDWEEYEVVILNDDTPVVGYVIVDKDGRTLDRDLFWSANKDPERGYVHTEDSLDIIRATCDDWPNLPTGAYAATYLLGEVQVSLFEYFDSSTFVQVKDAPNADIVWPVGLSNDEFVVLYVRGLSGDYRYFLCLTIHQAKLAIEKTLYSSFSQKFFICKRA